MALLLALALVATACHLTGGYVHISSMHTADGEEYCRDTTASSIDETLFQQFLAGTLYGDPTRDWHDFDGTARVIFVPYGEYANDCDNMPFTTWIEVVVQDDPGPICGYNPSGNPYSCVMWTNDPQVYCMGYEHCHLRKPTVYLATSHINLFNDAGRHVINHEFGHVFGLDDPVDGPADTSWRHCERLDPQGNAIWIDSIMHAPDSYCDATGEFRAWPTYLDFVAAGVVTNQP